jgi:hypothetical protein
LTLVARDAVPGAHADISGGRVACFALGLSSKIVQTSVHSVPVDAQTERMVANQLSLILDTKHQAVEASAGQIVGGGLRDHPPTPRMQPAALRPCSVQFPRHSFRTAADFSSGVANNSGNTTKIGNHCQFRRSPSIFSLRPFKSSWVQSIFFDKT